MSAALCRTNSSGQRNFPPFTTPRSSSTIAFVSDAPLISPRACSSATSCVKPNVRAGASSVAKLSGVTSYVPACRPINGCGHSIDTVNRNVLPGATTYVASLSVTVNGASTVSTAGSPPTAAGPACASASKYGCTLPSRIGGSGPVSSIVRSSITCAATAASTCSTVWIVASPCPIAVRRSTASTSASRAGTSGLPARSVRRNTMPCPAGAGRNVASVAAPVWSPVPRSAVRRVTERLVVWAIGRRLYESFELVHDLREAVHRRLGAQVLAPRARRVAEQRRARGHITDQPRLHEDARPAPDGEMIRDPYLTGDDHVVLHLAALRDAGLRHDEAARTDPHVVRDVDQVVDLCARSDHGIIHAAAVDARVRADLDVIPDEAAAHVRNLAVGFATPLARDVPEPVAAEHRARVHDHPLPERGARIQRDAGIQLRVVADRDAVAEHAARADAHVAPELHLAAETGVGADGHRLLPGRPPADVGRGVDAGFPDGLRIQHGKHDQQRRVRLGYDDARLGSAGRCFERRRDEHHRRAGALKVGDVAGRGKKRKVAGTRALERRNPGDRYRARPHQLAAGERSYLTSGEWTRGELLRLPEALQHPRRDVQRGVRRGHDSAAGVDVQNHRVVHLGADSLNHRGDPCAERSQQVLFTLPQALLQLGGALLDALLHRLEVLLLRLPRGGRERNRLLIEDLDRRIELRLQLLILGLRRLQLFPVRRFGDHVAGRVAQDLLGVDERNPGRRSRGRSTLPGQDSRCREGGGDGGERHEHETLHNAGTPDVGRGTWV